MNDHHCHYCNRDIVADIKDPCGSALDAAARCPHCGASDLDYQHEFGIDEPWVKPLPQDPDEKDQAQRIPT